MTHDHVTLAAAHEHAGHDHVPPPVPLPAQPAEDDGAWDEAAAAVRRCCRCGPVLLFQPRMVDAAVAAECVVWREFICVLPHFVSIKYHGVYVCLLFVQAAARPARRARAVAAAPSQSAVVGPDGHVASAGRGVRVHERRIELPLDGQRSVLEPDMREAAAALAAAALAAAAAVGAGGGEGGTAVVVPAEKTAAAAMARAREREVQARCVAPPLRATVAHRHAGGVGMLRERRRRRSSTRGVPR